MISVKQLIDVPVHSQQEGGAIGVVQDVCIDPQQTRLNALLLTTAGLIPTRHILYWQDIADVQPAAIYIAAKHVLYPEKDMAADWWTTSREPGIWGREIRNVRNEPLGYIGDLIIERSGRIVGCEMSDGFFHDLIEGRRRLSGTYSIVQEDDDFRLVIHDHP